MSWGYVAVAAGSILGGYLMSQGSQSAADTAANAQLQAANLNYDLGQQNLQQQQNQFNYITEQQRPWQEAGLSALSQYQQDLKKNIEAPGLTKLNLSADSYLPKDFSFNANDLYSDPSYAFRKSQGEEVINRTNAASGNFFSGRRIIDLINYNQNLASTEYGNAFDRARSTYGINYNRGMDLFKAALGQESTNYDRTMQDYALRYGANRDYLSSLASIFGPGQSATNTVSSAAANMGNNLSSIYGTMGTNMGNALIGAGNAHAAGQLGQANAYGNTMSSLAYLYGNYMNNNSTSNNYSDSNAWLNSNGLQ